MEALKEKKVHILIRNNGNGLNVAAKTPAVQKRIFFPFFSKNKSNGNNGHGSKTDNKSAPLLSQEPILKNNAWIRSAEIKSWVALEEKIVGEYGRPKAEGRGKSGLVLTDKPVLPQVKSSPVKPSGEIKQPAPVLRPQTDKIVKGHSGFRFATVLFLIGWVGAAFLASLYFKESSLRQDLEASLSQLQDANKRLQKTFGDLQNTANNQKVELQRLNAQVRTMAGDLRSAQKKAATYDIMERSYREELFGVTTHYEEQIDALNKTVQSQDALIAQLRSKLQTIKEMIAKGELMPASGPVGALAKPVQDQGVKPDGKVMMVNSRYAFIVANVGALQGAQTGRILTVYHNGQKIAQGKVEKAYPALSAVAIWDQEALNQIQEGDPVFLNPA